MNIYTLKNIIKTTLLLSALTVLLMLIGFLYGGQGTMMIAFVFAIVMNVGSYWFSDKIVLKMYHAKEVTRSQAPELHQIVINLSLIHISEPTRLGMISYAVFCLKK